MSELSDLLQRLNTERWSSRRIESEASKHGHQLSNATAAKYLRGDHPDRPNHATLQAFADVFSVPASRLRAAVGLPGLSEPFDLGPESARLTGGQRAAIRHVVRVMLEQNDAVPDRAVEDVPTTDDEDLYGLAALKRPSRGKALKREADRLGEESQDSGTDEPA